MKEVIIAVVAFILMDILSGVAAAAKEGTLQSSVMRQGLYHKCGELMLVGLATACQMLVTVNGFDGFVPPNVFTAVAVYVVAMEFVSILENIGKLVPGFDINKISKLFGRNGDKNE